MKIKRLLYKLKLPCPKCPYKLGLVKTLCCPCPGCRLNDYRMYEIFQNRKYMGQFKRFGF